MKTFLQNALKDITLIWIHGIKFVFAVSCPCNDSPRPRASIDAFKFCHLLPLEDCLSKTKIRCTEKQVWVDTGVFKMWFQGDLKSAKAKQGKFVFAMTCQIFRY